MGRYRRDLVHTMGNEDRGQQGWDNGIRKNSPKILAWTSSKGVQPFESDSDIKCDGVHMNAMFPVPVIMSLGLLPCITAIR
jgi:hypothetical protein